MSIARTLLVSAIAAAAAAGGCDLQPPSKQPPRAAQTAPPPVTPAVPAVPAVPAGGSAAPAPAFEITQPCAEAGVKTAELMIAAAADPNERAVLEHDARAWCGGPPRRARARRGAPRRSPASRRRRRPRLAACAQARQAAR